jgi:hypothetical protein
MKNERKIVFEISLFWNEDVIFLERIRNTLKYADKFFIAEGNESHSGRIKRDFRIPSLLEKIPDEMRSRVVFVPVDLSIVNEQNPFVRERLVRDAALQVAIRDRDFTRDSVLIIQDFDEFIIPDRIKCIIEELFSWRFWNKAIRLRQRFSYYKLNLMSCDDWSLSLICKGSLVLKDKFSANQWRHQLAKKRTRITRDYVGWHHSYLGDLNFIRNKIDSFAEANIQMVKDVTDQDILAALQSGADLFGRNIKYQQVSYVNVDPIPDLLHRNDLMIP